MHHGGAWEYIRVHESTMGALWEHYGSAMGATMGATMLESLQMESIFCNSD